MPHLLSVGPSSLPTLEILGSAHSTREQALFERASTIINAHRRASSTNRVYFCAFERFRCWCEAYGYCPLPAAPRTVLLYFSELSEDANTFAIIRTHSAAIFATHEDMGAPSPTRDPSVLTLYKSLENMLGVHPVNRKLPFTQGQVRDLLRFLTSVRFSDLGHLQLACMIACAFIGLLRFSDLCLIRPCDVRVADDRSHALIRLLGRKNDQRREGDICYIPAAEPPYERLCPVELLRRLLAATDNPSRALFRKLDKRKFKAGVPSTLPDPRLDEVAPREQAVDLLRELLQTVFKYTPAQAMGYTFHSFRSGGATALVAAGASTEELQTVGGWRSSSVPYTYVQRDAPSRIELARRVQGHPGL